jgi:hypothetical protein
VYESYDIGDVKLDMKDSTLGIQPIWHWMHPFGVLTSDLHRITYANAASYLRLVPQGVVIFSGESIENLA